MLKFSLHDAVVVRVLFDSDVLVLDFELDEEFFSIGFRGVRGFTVEPHSIDFSDPLCGDGEVIDYKIDNAGFAKFVISWSWYNPTVVKTIVMKFWFDNFDVMKGGG